MKLSGRLRLPPNQTSILSILLNAAQADNFLATILYEEPKEASDLLEQPIPREVSHFFSLGRRGTNSRTGRGPWVCEP